MREASRSPARFSARPTGACWTWARSAVSIALPRPSPRTTAAWSGSLDTVTTTPRRFGRGSGRYALRSDVANQQGVNHGVDPGLRSVAQLDPLHSPGGAGDSGVVPG